MPRAFPVLIAGLVAGAVAAPLARADHGHFEATTLFGVGRILGRGSDAWRRGTVLGLGAGVRLGDWFSVHLTGQAHALRLRAASGEVVSGTRGRFLMGDLAVRYHPFGQHRLFDLAVGPVAGVGWVHAVTQVGEGRAEADERAWHVGGSAAVLVRIDDRVALGPHVQVTRAFTTTECIEINDGARVCERPSSRPEGFLSGHLMLRFPF